MLTLVFVALPVVVALYTLLLSRFRLLVLWAAVLTLLLETFLCSQLPLEQPFRVLGATLSLTSQGRLFLYAFLLMGGFLMVVAQLLRQGELPIPIGMFILSVTHAIVLLDDPIVVSLLLEIIGLAIVLGTVDRPHEPVGLLPIPALMAGLKYLIMMVLAGITLVMGFLMVNLAVETQQGTYAKVALGLIVTGFGLGTAVVPLHLWFPDLAGQTSTAITGFLVSLVQGAAMLFLGKVFLRFPELFLNNPRGSLWLTTGAIVAGTAAALLAAGQSRLKRLAAYVASYDVAMVLYAFGLASEKGVETGLLLAIHHGLALILLLTCIGVLEWSTGRDDVSGLVGVAHRMPLVTLGLVAATLSLAGIPPFGGFVGRWSLYTQALDRGWGFLAGLLLATALFLLAMVRALWPIVLPTEQTVDIQRPPWQVMSLIVLLVIALLLLGTYSGPVTTVLEGVRIGLTAP